MNEIEVTAQLDTKGLFCPEPVMMLHTKIDEMVAGEVLHVLATDPSTTRDIPKFCKFLGHELISCESDELTYSYWIKKGPEG